MKKLIFAVAILMSMVLTSYGKNAGKNNKLVKDLIAASKTAQSSATANNGVFKTSSFTLNGNTVSAFYDVENDDLIGFSIPVSLTDLPASSLDNLKKKYGKYTAQTAMMFINRDGYFGFYVLLTRPEKPSIVLDVNTKGKAHYYGKM